jgi:A/G-specific adenine glycosylase
VTIVTGVLRQGGAVFVQKRLEGSVWGGLWEFPGGRLEPGETPEEGVIREFMEETGFAVEVSGKHGVIVHYYTSYKVTLHCFVLHLPADGTPSPPCLTAAVEWRWVTPAELEGLPLPSPHRKLASMLFGATRPAN